MTKAKNVKEEEENEEMKKAMKKWRNGENDVKENEEIISMT